MSAFHTKVDHIFCHYVSIFQMADYLLSLRRLNRNQETLTYAYRTDSMLAYSIIIWKDNI